MKWTKEQEKIIDSRNSDLLVSAAAGSGKTAVLVERVLCMIKEGTNIDELLIVTFTRAAAAQMREKLANKLLELAEEDPFNEHYTRQLSLIHRADIATIDSFCLGIVKDNFNVVGLDSSFDIADNAEMSLLKSDVMKELLEKYYSEGSTEFIKLVESFSTKENDKEIEDLINHVYKVCSSFPDPFEWIKEAEQSLLIKDEQQLNHCSWMGKYMTDFHAQVSSAKIMAKRCLEICNFTDGPLPYVKAITADLDLIDSLDSIKTYGELGGVSLPFARLSNIKKGTCDEDSQEKVKNYRNTYKDMLNKIIKNTVPVKKVLAQLQLCEPALLCLLKVTKEYMVKLDQIKRKKSKFEFQDIEHMALRILCEKKDQQGQVVASKIGHQVAKKYKEIIVDEYQDSSFLQEDILNCVAGRDEGLHNMFMVGDVKQSIYKFRMARPDLFLFKYAHYSEEDPDKKRLLLSKNFRSRNTVLQITNRIFEKLMSTELGDLDYTEEVSLKYGDFEKNDPKEDEKAELLIVSKNPEAEEDYDKIKCEARAIAWEINKIVNGPEPLMILDDRDKTAKGVYRKIEYRDIVILVRGLKPVASVFDDIFEEYGIPLFLESENGYFDATEISTLLSMLSLVDNVYQDSELAAALTSPLAHITSDELAFVVGAYQNAVQITKKTYLYDKLVEFINVATEKTEKYEKLAEICNKTTIEEKESFSQKCNKILCKLQSFFDMLSFLHKNKKYMSIREMIDYILKSTGYYWFVGARMGGERRQANIDMLISKADAYEESSYKGLFNFLRYVNRLKINEVDFAEASILGDNENVVRLMTMHKSKGLEFPVVFVSNLGKNFSTQDTKNSVIVHPDYFLFSDVIDTENRIKCSSFSKKAICSVINIEARSEEMRILYVALTRAKNKLYMTGAVDNYEKLLEKCGPVLEDDQGKINYGNRVQAGNYLEWILMALKFFDTSNLLDKTVLYHNEIPVESSKGILMDGIAAASELKEATELEKISRLKETTELEEASERLIEIKDKINTNLDFQYPFSLKEPIKTKMSITEIKKLQSQGEENPGKPVFEEENSENKLPLLNIFKQQEVLKGTEIGTLMHKAMECMDFNCSSLEEVKNQVNAMLSKGLLPKEAQGNISETKLFNMVSSPVGKRMGIAQNKGLLFREQQFYTSMPASEIYLDMNTKGYEDILVQGIIDAYFIEDGEIVLLDYKTDKVNKIEDLVTRYHVQLDKYAETIEKITGLKAKEKVIYAFHFDEEILLP